MYIVLSMYKTVSEDMYHSKSTYVVVENTDSYNFVHCISRNDNDTVLIPNITTGADIGF